MQIFIYCKVTLHVSLQRGLISHVGGKAVPVLWPVPEAAVTAFSTPDDGYCDTRNMFSDFAVNKYLYTVASGWIFINIVLYSLRLVAICHTILHAWLSVLQNFFETIFIPSADDVLHFVIQFALFLLYFSSYNAGNWTCYCLTAYYHESQI